MASQSYIALHRFCVPDSTLEEVRQHLERTEDTVRINTYDTLRRYTLRGVPAKQIDVLLCPEIPAGLRLVCEIGDKSGKYDASVRTRISLRPWSPNRLKWQDSAGVNHLIPEGKLVVDCSEGTGGNQGVYALTAIWQAEEGEISSWTRVYHRLRSDLNDYDLARVVIWHWNRYYHFLPYEEVEALAQSFKISAGPRLQGATLAEANRLASQELYQLARNLGWRKLTRRERVRLGMGEESGQWHRTDRLPTIGGGPSPTGCGEYTLEAASGQIPMRQEEIMEITPPVSTVE